MKNIFKVITILVLICTQTLCHAHEFSKIDWTDKLTLVMAIGKKGSEQNQLPLIVTLHNSSAQTFKFITSTNPHPLSIVLLTPKGKQARLDRLLRMVKNSTNPGKIVVMKPNEKVVFNKSFDLTDFIEEISGSQFVEFSASYGFSIRDNDTLEVVRINSNKVKYKGGSKSNNK